MKLSLLILFFASLATISRAQDVACEPIAIFAAASTTNVIEEIAAEYERNTACSVTTVFAGSGTLARQIASGAPADLFLSANTDWMDWLQQSGTIKSNNKMNLLGNDLVLIVPKGTNVDRLDITQPESLLAFLGPGRLAMGDPASVPAGHYATLILRHMGLAKKLETNIITAASVRAALTWVARGEAAAGIVYRTDATIEDDLSIAATFPALADAPIVYPLALVGRSPNEAARAFYQHLQTYDAALIFTANGFRRAGSE